MLCLGFLSGRTGSCLIGLLGCCCLFLPGCCTRISFGLVCRITCLFSSPLACCCCMLRGLLGNHLIRFTLGYCLLGHLLLPDSLVAFDFALVGCCAHRFLDRFCCSSGLCFLGCLLGVFAFTFVIGCCARCFLDRLCLLSGLCFLGCLLCVFAFAFAIGCCARRFLDRLCVSSGLCFLGCLLGIFDIAFELLLGIFASMFVLGTQHCFEEFLRWCPSLDHRLFYHCKRSITI